MYSTSYHKASSVAEAASLLAGAADAKYLAGGQTLIPTMKQRLAAPSDLVDLSKIPGLAGIEVSGDMVKIGGAARHFDVANSAAVSSGFAQLITGVPNANSPLGP